IPGAGFLLSTPGGIYNKALFILPLDPAKRTSLILIVFPPVCTHHASKPPTKINTSAKINNRMVLFDELLLLIFPPLSNFVIVCVMFTPQDVLRQLYMITELPFPLGRSTAN